MPYSLAAQQLLVKFTVGPLFAILGIMLLQLGLIDRMRPFEDFGLAVLVFAAVFGGSQQVLTGFIDRRASRPSILNVTGGLRPNHPHYA